MRYICPDCGTTEYLDDDQMKKCICGSKLEPQKEEGDEKPHSNNED